MLRKATLFTFLLLLAGTTSTASAERLITEGPCVPVKPVSLEHLFALPKFAEVPQQYPEAFLKEDAARGEGVPYLCQTLLTDAKAGGTHSDELEGKAYANGHAVLVSVREESLLKAATPAKYAEFSSRAKGAAVEIHKRTLLHPFTPIPQSGAFKPGLYGATMAAGGHEVVKVPGAKLRSHGFALYLGAWTRELPAAGPVLIELQMRATPGKPVAKWFSLIEARVIPGLLKHAEEVWNSG
jgi:hypothetical protein